jgi:hypothetical protein
MEYAAKGIKNKRIIQQNNKSSVAEPHHFYVALGDNFDSSLAPTAPAQAPTLL